MALMEGEKISISKKPMPLKFDSLYSEKEGEYKEFNYTPNLKNCRKPLRILKNNLFRQDQKLKNISLRFQSRLMR